MALGKIVVTSLVLLAFILSSVTAFVSPLSSMTGLRVSTASSRTHTSGSAGHGLLMACRPNAKKAKRQRNRDNMRKFTKRGTSRKKVMRVQRQERAAEAESNFMAQVFHSGMDDWEDVDIFAED